MAIEVTWYGHATWQIKINDGSEGSSQKTILLDPFFADNPVSPVSKDDVSADAVLISHGHFDHVADAAEITNRNDATMVAIYLSLIHI